MATAEFSKFAGILSVALSQHHLSKMKDESPGYLVGKLAVYSEEL